MLGTIKGLHAEFVAGIHTAAEFHAAVDAHLDLMWKLVEPER